MFTLLGKESGSCRKVGLEHSQILWDQNWQFLNGQSWELSHPLELGGIFGALEDGKDHS